jgi:CYTH domain-containing protein
MKQQEIERVFLVKELPKDIAQAKHFIIRVGDFFDSNSRDALKIKQKGEECFIIKKHWEDIMDKTEHIISIKKGEFDVLWKCTVQNHEKIRFIYPLGHRICEIDYYLGRLDGYVRAEVEFKSMKEAKEFVPPAWFADEITQCNHDIHENLGTVTLGEMKERYDKRGIKLKKIKLPENFKNN